MICGVQCTVNKILHQTVNDIATTVQISYASCHAIFTKDLMTSQSASHVVPHPLTAMLHQTRREICQDLIFLWMTISHLCITSSPMTRHVGQANQRWHITPSLFSKNWQNTTLLCYHNCHVLQTSGFQTFFLVYHCHTKHVHVPLGTTNTNAYFQDAGLAGPYAGW